jgi:hypothetical protein
MDKDMHSLDAEHLNEEWLSFYEATDDSLRIVVSALAKKSLR